MKNNHSQETLVPRRGDVGHVGEVSGVVVAGTEVELGEDHLALLVEHLALLRVALAALALLVLGHLLEVELTSL